MNSSATAAHIPSLPQPQKHKQKSHKINMQLYHNPNLKKLSPPSALSNQLKTKTTKKTHLRSSSAANAANTLSALNAVFFISNNPKNI